jgi:voltage-gated potassium channel Kch
VQRWERRSEVPLLLLAVAFLVAYAWPVLDPRLDADLRTVLTFASWTVWGAFAIDFAIRVRLADERLRYLGSHWYDVALIVEANIGSFGDALWWASTTVTTVGYGDHYPVTTEGRFIAVALMVVGIAVVGAVTASVATWMVSQVRQERESASS